MTVLKVTSHDRREFFTSETDTGKIMSLPGVYKVEEVEMTAEEYQRIPASIEATMFFAGSSRIAGRPE